MKLRKAQYEGDRKMVLYAERANGMDSMVWSSAWVGFENRLRIAELGRPVLSRQVIPHVRRVLDFYRVGTRQDAAVLLAGARGDAYVVVCRGTVVTVAEEFGFVFGESISGCPLELDGEFCLWPPELNPLELGAEGVRDEVDVDSRDLSAAYFIRL
ncbi:uncharacterized protein MYCGRDRAFT_92980 [Zymoseptoria tritici IPO323]|uniref:Uncharacterized protein n=1 Tax=Zymoseptoria tritici (strain CBS 115943 / IPO323) TaxID=336722 RepID=F9XAM7_ZYMTI|nr:uncharacterized protein MYCGRDRAFT_92980 [Zymoseptoria tritici IPO323]EGP87026.1 hypothetical protein MYCGRDRAFT_92980 [Zymoseptoria tritici IPO323]